MGPHLKDQAAHRPENSVTRSPYLIGVICGMILCVVLVDWIPDLSGEYVAPLTSSLEVSPTASSFVEPHDGGRSHVQHKENENGTVNSPEPADTRTNPADTRTNPADTRTNPATSGTNTSTNGNDTPNEHTFATSTAQTITVSTAFQASSLVPSHPAPVQFLPTNIHDNKLLFVYFHKTGNNLTKKIIYPLSQGIDAVAQNIRHLRRQPIPLNPPLPMLKEIDWVATAAPIITTRAWAITRQAWPKMRMVVFLRDPYAMAISGWSYHTNAPHKEYWAHQAENSRICEQRDNMAIFTAKRDVFGIEEHQLQAIQDLCNEIDQGIPGHKGMTYKEKLGYLNTLGTGQGAVLEGIRLILSGDLVHMLNHVQATRGDSTVLNLYLSQFTQSSKSFDRTLDCLATFAGIDGIRSINYVSHGNTYRDICHRDDLRTGEKESKTSGGLAPSNSHPREPRDAEFDLEYDANENGEFSAKLSRRSSFRTRKTSIV